MLMCNRFQTDLTLVVVFWGANSASKQCILYIIIIIILIIIIVIVIITILIIITMQKQSAYQ